jgi:Na+-transporting NADH:ubiquinone oxidoreductase subunit B
MARPFFDPVREALDSVVRATDRATSGAPHVRDAIDTKRVQLTFLIALVPPTLAGVWNVGHQANAALAALGRTTAAGWRGPVLTLLGADGSGPFGDLAHGLLWFLPIYAVCLVTGLFWETLFAAVRERRLGTGLWTTALLFALTLPPLIPLWQVSLGMTFGIVVGQELFGGYGRHVLNTALVGRAFLYYAYPDGVSGDAVWVAVDGYTRATPLAVLSAADADIGLDALSETWRDAFLGDLPGSMGETSAVACLVGATILLATGVASWRVMLAMVAGGAATAALLGAVGSETDAMYGVPVGWQLVLGSFAFGTVFFAPDPVTSAQTDRGRFVYGALIGVLAILLRVTNPGLPEGVMMAVLLGNIFAPVIDWAVEEANIRRRAARRG